MLPVGPCFLGVAVGTLGNLCTCYICQSVATSLMLCMVANFFCNVLCHSYNAAFHYREMGGPKFRLGVHRKNEEGRKSVERRKSENSSLTVSLPITVYFNRPAEVISPCTIDNDDLNCILF